MHEDMGGKQTVPNSAYPRTGRFLQGRLRHALTDREKSVIEELVSDVVDVDAGTTLLERGDLVDHSTMLIEGFMLRTVWENGDRHVVGFQVPGDFVDLHAFALKRLDHGLVALGDIKVGYVTHEALERVLAHEPHIARIFWFSTLLDAAIHREWIMKTAQLRAMGRIAHLIAEIWYRLRVVGLGNSRGFRTPLSQTDLADICGISTVHVSRTLADLREGGVVDFRRGRITILDGEKLKKIGMFDPVYLYGEGGLEVRDELSDTYNS